MEHPSLLAHRLRVGYCRRKEPVPGDPTVQASPVVVPGKRQHNFKRSISQTPYPKVRNNAITVSPTGLVPNQMSSNYVRGARFKSYGGTKKNPGHSDKVAITVIHVTCTGSRDVHSTVINNLMFVTGLRPDVFEEPDVDLRFVQAHSSLQGRRKTIRENSRRGSRAPATIHACSGNESVAKFKSK